MENLQIKYLFYAALSAFSLSVGGNYWTHYKMSKMSETIQKQLKGELSETAKKIAESNKKELGTLKSTMVSRAELDRHSEKIIKGLSEDTQKAISKFTSETGAKVDSISERVMGMEGRLSDGISSLGKRRSKVKTPPPKTWKGVKKRDIDLCAQHPDRCDRFTFSWESPFKVNGKPMARFSSLNLWEGGAHLDLNLAFKVVAITYGENKSKLGSGAVQNQGIHVMAGYVNDEGGFVQIPGLESKLLEGDVNLGNGVIYTPPLVLDPPTLRLFEPSLLLGSTYQAGEFGLSIGGSLLNLQGGKYRFGLNGIATQSNIYLGFMSTWHPYILGKHLNVAPSLGWVLGADSSNTWSLGLNFQVW